MTSFAVELRRRLGDGRWRGRLSRRAEPPSRLLGRFGETPLPPYIKRGSTTPSATRPIYAAAEGSAAAPTAGLHFTRRRRRGARVPRGVAIEHLTLHVGLATFKPVTADVLEDHPLHDEPFTVRRGRLAAHRDAAADGRRVVAVGTTMVRLLEELRRRQRRRQRSTGSTGSLRGRTGLFITPGFEFGLVDGMLTNFHLPRTSLLGPRHGLLRRRGDAPRLLPRDRRPLSLLQLRRRDAGLPDGATGRRPEAAS